MASKRNFEKMGAEAYASLSSSKFTKWTVGMGCPATRAAMDARAYFPRWALNQVSSDGVAEPSTTLQFSNTPRMTATSRAL